MAAVGSQEWADPPAQVPPRGVAPLLQEHILRGQEGFPRAPVPPMAPVVQEAHDKPVAVRTDDAGVAWCGHLPTTGTARYLAAAPEPAAPSETRILDRPAGASTSPKKPPPPETSPKSSVTSQPSSMAKTPVVTASC